MGKKGVVVLFSIVFLLLVPCILAETYVADLSFTTSQVVYTVNERIELIGGLYLTNYSDNGSLLNNGNHTGLSNLTINVDIIDQSNNVTASSYLLNTSVGGEFYSQSNYYANATLVSAPSTAKDYYIKVNYTDPNNVTWWTQSEIQIVNQTIDHLLVSGDKISYDPNEVMIVTAEAVQEVGDQLIYVSNVSINGSIRTADASKTFVSAFSCTTENNGKCSVSTNAPSSFGNYYLEVNGFKGFTYIEVNRFNVNIKMKDELGKSIKHIFSSGEQASIEVGVVTNSTTETYTFDGEVKDSSGGLVTTINSTALNVNNSYTNRFTFNLDTLNFSSGTYLVEVNVTQTGDGVVSTSTSFEVKSWDLTMKKREAGSGFEYEHSTFPNKTIYLEIYPSWRSNGTIIDEINTTTSMNVSLTDTMNNQLKTANASWNATCGIGGCYDFSLSAPETAGAYYLSARVSHNGEVQIVRKKVNVVSASIFGQSTDKDGNMKELFGTDEFAYISLSAKNSSVAINLTNVSLVAVTYMNGTEYTYLEQNNFELVNGTNSNLEWAWNNTLQRLKFDVPKIGGIYTVYLTADNSTSATSVKFMVNPYDVCMVAKDTAGQAGGSTGNYYVYQFRTSDTVYFEMKITQANNPTGKASVFNSTNSSYGMGAACVDQSATKQVVNNATVTIEEVINTQTGKVYSLNGTESTCQADDEKGGYTCTVKPIGTWDGGGYGVKFKIVGQDGQTSDITYGGFEARAFYLYSWSSNWRNKPTANISLTISMYEAGSNWWGNYGSGGLSGTVEVEKVEYQGREGEWLGSPINYGYNVSQLNVSSVTNGQGTINLLANNTPEGEWKTGSYRVILKGTDNGGNTDYGYAWFSVKKWEVYASSVDCSGTSCNRMYNVNSKNNVSLYVTINNAGEWGQSGNDLGGTVAVSVKKIKDCRRWPCSDLNSSLYTATLINVSKSSGWYYSSANASYMINLTPTGGTWGTGYWQIILDVNGSETGSGWFNTIAFYVSAKPSDITGNNWKYSIKNNRSKYFKVTTTKSQKGGYYYTDYNASEYLNTTIDSAYLRRWDQDTQAQVEYNYPNDFNITIVGGGTVINGTKIINMSYSNRSWISGYYNGELTLKNLDNETSSSWIWFQVRPFRVQMVRDQYSIDNDVCINGTINIYEPDWSNNALLNGTYNITQVTERIWTGYGSSLITYANYTPAVTFNGTSNFSICPNATKWGSGSWGNYHYLTVKIKDADGNTESGWLSFKTIPFSISWGAIVGGTDVLKSSNFIVSVNLSKASSNASATGNITKIYQWRYDTYPSTKEEYDFSVGGCDTRTAGVNTCMVTGLQNVTIYAPSGSWKDGDNYLQAEWTESDDASIKVDDISGKWFNGVDIYDGWWSNVQEDGTGYQWNFGVDVNLSIKLHIRNSAGVVEDVNLTKVEYAVPTPGCWLESCRSYTNATGYEIVNQSTSNRTISESGTIKIVKPSGNWSVGRYNIRATVNGVNGSTIITGGEVNVKDITNPTVNVTIPTLNYTINTSTFWVNWTTNEAATCVLTLVNYDTYHSWYCNGWETPNATNGSVTNVQWVNSCNTTKYSDFNGSVYDYEYVRHDYRYWNRGSTGGWFSGSTGLVTGGTNHYYKYDASAATSQYYGLVIWCTDPDVNAGQGYTVVDLNVSGAGAQISTSLLVPANASTATSNPVQFNYTYTSSAQTSVANCSLYGNFTGSWQRNESSQNMARNKNQSFNKTLPDGKYIWNVRCIQPGNISNYDWADNNFTLTFSLSSNAISTSLLSPASDSNLTTNALNYFNYSFTGSSEANCSLYGNFNGSWHLNYTSNNKSKTVTNSFNVTLVNGTYIWNIKCVNYTNSSNSDWGDANFTLVFNITSDQTNVQLIAPTNDSSWTKALPVYFNYSVNGPTSANCSLYSNYTGSWLLNQSIGWVFTPNSEHEFNRTMADGKYLWNVYCIDENNNSNIAWANDNWTITVNSDVVNTVLLFPTNNSNLTSNPSTYFNYSFTGSSEANCSLYGNFNGSWHLNYTSNNKSGTVNNSFNVTLINGTYLWNVKCVNYTNSSNSDWGENNLTFILNITSDQTNVQLISPTNDSSWTTSSLVNLNYSFNGPLSANCSLYTNYTGSWSRNQSIGWAYGPTPVHSFNRTLPNGKYLWGVYCIDERNSSNTAWANDNWTFVVATNPGVVSVSLGSPANNSNWTTDSPLAVLNYSFSGSDEANCSLYGNFNGSWHLNQTVTNRSRTVTSSFNVTLVNGSHLWNVKCINYTNGSNTDWANDNFTIKMYYYSLPINIWLVAPTNNSNSSLVNFWNYSVSGPSLSNCTLYSNFSGTWEANITIPGVIAANSAGNRFFTQSQSIVNGNYLWNVYCIDRNNVSNYGWSAQNWTYLDW